jgi:hypothetical protein
MTYKAYIHKDGKFPITDWAMSAYYGFKERNTRVILFDDFDKVPLNKFNIIVSGVNNTIKRLKDLGIEPPNALNIPEELNKYHFLNRKVRKITFEKFKKEVEDDWITFPVFIKPDGYAKQFVAGPVSKKENALHFFKDVCDECTLILSDVIDIVSEYRCYIVNKELVGIKHYLGDVRVFPNIKVIDEAISKYETQPVAYSLDFGITNKGVTVLIEANDAWSLGNYGLNNDVYAGMLAKRWHQLMCQK